MTAGLDVSRETHDRLLAYAALIEKWTTSINLIAPKSVPDIWDRHILDSAQIYDLAPKGWNSWVDLGSGGGLPGLVIAILDPEERPVTLIESDRRKCLFLNTVRRELSLNVTILNERIDAANVYPSSVVSARALAPLPDLLRMATRFLEPEGVALFPKGERYKQELDQAQEDWQFDVDEIPSRTSSASRILKVSRITAHES